MSRRIRRAALVFAAAAFLALGFRLWCLDGLFRRITIEGPSMAPAFCGPRYEVTCGDCRFAFRCDAEHVPAHGKAACPSCGYTENLLAEANLKPADRVVIDRWPLLFRAPRRGEVVAFRLNSSSNDIAIKRIAFLPGERPAIRSGQLDDDQLGRDEYFVLGDNQSVSIDSRLWNTPVKRKEILGIVRKR